LALPEALYWLIDRGSFGTSEEYPSSEGDSESRAAMLASGRKPRSAGGKVTGVYKLRGFCDQKARTDEKSESNVKVTLAET